MTASALGADLLARIRQYGSNETYYRSAAFKETEARVEFIDPLLRALGWDLDNKKRLSPEYREVKREQSQAREGDSFELNPDYTMSAQGVAQFYVEAKRPSVNIASHMPSILQARRYGWTGNHPIVVLTNFAHLAIYDATVKPIQGVDRPETALIARWSVNEIEQGWSDIRSLLGRDEVHSPDWAKGFKNYTSLKRVPAGEAFIEHYNDWRVLIGNDLIQQNPQMSDDEVNDAAQQILNRFIFVRMCEDRGIEGEDVLGTAFASGATSVATLFKRLNDRYNTGLFASTGSAKDPVPKVSVKTLDHVVSRLYSPASPFSFAVLDADFLGRVYEASLAQHLVSEDRNGRRAVALNEKVEYNRRDVVTTPQGMVTATVRRAVQALDPALECPDVLDFAVGSGRFLLRAFDEILDRELVRAVERDDTGLRKVGEDDYRLPFERKRALLVDHFFGIDIDFNAVEIARFSLIIRLLQDETAHSLPRGNKILPDLTANVVHGNTLVRDLPSGTPQAVLEKTRPLNLTTTALPAGFDLVVGNPPYMDTEAMKDFDKAELAYLKRMYSTAHKQFDKYFAFVEFAASMLSDGGVLGTVIPNKWMTIESATKIRSLLRTDLPVVDLANFRDAQVFEGKSIYVCSLVAKRAAPTDLAYSEPRSAEEFFFDSAERRLIPLADLPTSPEDPLVLPANGTEAHVFDALFRDSVPLGSVVDARVGVQTSRNGVYVLTNVAVDGSDISFVKRDPASKQLRTWQIEIAATRPYLDDSSGVRSHFEVTADARIIFPYRPTSSTSHGSGFEVIPEQEMKRLYPKAFAYLLAHKADLDRRDVNESERRKAFYIYGRTQAIGYCALAPKIFYSTNQKGEKYGLDTTGIVYQSGGTAGEVALYPTDLEYSLDFVLAVLDQAPIEFYLRKRGSPFRGGYYARGLAVIVDAPIPRLDFGAPIDRAFHDEVASEMAALRALHAKIAATPDRGMSALDQQIAAGKRTIRRLFLRRWNLSESEVDALGAISHA